MRAAAGGLPGGDGGVLERAPLGAQAARAGLGRAADRGPLRHPLSHGRQERQERRHRRGGDLRGGIAAEHALRAGQDLRAAGRDEPAPRARRAQGRAHRLHQPDPRRAGRVRPGVRQEPQGLARRAGRRDRGCEQRTQHDGAPGDAARAAIRSRRSAAAYSSRGHLGGLRERRELAGGQVSAQDLPHGGFWELVNHDDALGPLHRRQAGGVARISLDL